MYLSRLTLNMRSFAVQRDLANCQELHRTILKAFSSPSQPSLNDRNHVRQDWGVLYRIENNPKQNSAYILVQSKVEPQWSKLPTAYCINIEGPRLVTQQYESLTNGRILSFLLKANPTQKCGTSLKKERIAGKKNNGYRRFLNKTEEQLHWLAQKSATSGFQLLSVHILPEIYDVDVQPNIRVKGWKKERNDNSDSKVERELTFGAVTFQGHLKITDRDCFLETIANGIGSGKAYGFGLFSIAPPR